MSILDNANLFSFFLFYQGWNLFKIFRQFLPKIAQFSVVAAVWHLI